ncbi:hypothetical protein A1OW_20330 [Enterovibrio norvegicus]|uniref:hypothetical protein n=1 Tax=Enterovibrio norvegicus TaxID=188144 RepID=UPI0002DE38F5|nr:hypothetical protein [Enterovibrio norvegicus]OEF61221.1 hypothetical protein A1OW_20330 [Enterovibrio norvegicus]
MATTIQVVENLKVGRYVNIDGKRCEVERVSFSMAICEKMAFEEMFTVLSAEMHSRGLIKKGDDDNWYWSDSGEPIVPHEDWED